MLLLIVIVVQSHRRKGRAMSDSFIPSKFRDSFAVCMTNQFLSSLC